MTFPAITGRELLARSRHWATYRDRTVAGLVAVGIVTVLLVIAELFGAVRTIGGVMFQTLSWLGFAFCLFEGLRHTVDCLSSEKRNGTLGLLFLTELTGFDVVTGKLLVNSLAAFYSLLAAFPALAMPFIVGGVTAGEFWRMLLALLNTLFFSLAVGMMVSAIGREERTVWGGGLAALGLATVGLPVVDLALAGGDPAKLSPLFSLASPWGAFAGASDAEYALNPGSYWSAVGTTHLLAWLGLVLAGLILSRVWREPEHTAPSRWERLLTFKFLEARRSAAKEREERGKVPLYWLAQAGGSPLALELIIAGAGALSVALWAMDIAKSGAAAWIIVAIFWFVHWCLRIWVAAQASNAMAALRDSGMLELVLVAPITPDGLVNAFVSALRKKYYRAVGVLVAVELCLLALMMASVRDATIVFAVPAWGVALAILLLDLSAVTYTGLWYGLKLRKASSAVTRTVLQVLVLPYSVLILLPLSFCGLGVPVFFIAKSVAFVTTMRDQLHGRFAQAAAQAFQGEPEAPWWWPFGGRRSRTVATPPPLILPGARPGPPPVGGPPPLISAPLPLTGPPCVSCGKPMGGPVGQCPHCGWTQPGRG